MQDTNIFELATRYKYRFGYKGFIGVEDLWDLALDQLDEIYKDLKRKLAQEEEESLLTRSSVVNTELRNKIEIVKYIVALKFNEAAEAEKKSIAREQKRKIMDILADKENETLKNMSAEELRAMLEKL